MLGEKALFCSFACFGSVLYSRQAGDYFGWLLLNVLYYIHICMHFIIYCSKQRKALGDSKSRESCNQNKNLIRGLNQPMICTGMKGKGIASLSLPFPPFSRLQKFSLPHTNLNDGSEYMLHLTCNMLPKGFGPQKNTPASAGAWIFRIDRKIMSQCGRPKFVGARRPVMVSWSALASLIMILVASSERSLAVRYFSMPIF